MNWSHFFAAVIGASVLVILFFLISHLRYKKYYKTIEQNREKSKGVQDELLRNQDEAFKWIRTQIKTIAIKPEIIRIHPEMDKFLKRDRDLVDQLKQLNPGIPYMLLEEAINTLVIEISNQSSDNRPPN